MSDFDFDGDEGEGLVALFEGLRALVRAGGDATQSLLDRFTPDDARLNRLATHHALDPEAIDGARATYGGLVDGRRLTAGHATTRDGARIRIRFEAPPQVAPLRFRPEGRLQPLATALGARDDSLGDPAFDRVVRLDGPEPLLTAAFDARARLLAAELVSEAALTLDEGAFELVARPEQARGLFEDLRKLAASLAVDDPLARLRTTARTDPTAGIRRRAISLLAAHAAGEAATHDTCVGALDDTDHDVRRAAARLLADALSPERLAPLAKRLLRDPVLARTGLEALARTPDPALAPRARRWLTALDPATAIAACRALAALRDPAPQVELVALAADDQRHDALRRAALDALAAIGTPEVIEPLGKLTGPLAAAARETIRAIQTRLSADSGRISLVSETGKGAVSVATEGGAVSLVAKDEP